MRLENAMNISQPENSQKQKIRKTKNRFNNCKDDSIF